MLKRGIFICIILSFGLHLGAQSVSRKVLIGAGSVVSNGGYSLSQTIGEPVVKIIEDEEYILTQGFQQPSCSKFEPIEHKGSGVKVYPNPVIDKLMLELFGEESLEYSILIFGFNGAIYFNNDYPCDGNFKRIITLDVSSYQRGTYFVKVLTKNGSIDRLFKIEKM